MKLIAFDTSTKFLSIALSENGRVTDEFHEDLGIRHSELLAPRIKEMVRRSGWDIEKAELLAVGTGPGSFTGLRIGAATAKGLSLSTGCAVVGVPSMDAMLSRVPESIKRFAPLLDARKGKVYSCVYERGASGPVKRRGPELITAEKLLGSLSEKVVFFGDAITKYSQLIEACPLAEALDVDWYPRATEIARLARAVSPNGTVDPADLEPLYLYSRECSITDE